MTLVLTTRRATNGHLQTTAAVEHWCTHDNGIVGRLHIKGRQPRLNDKWEFSEVLLQEPAARATEKNVTAQHSRAIAAHALRELVQRVCAWQMMPTDTWPEEFRPQVGVTDDGNDVVASDAPRQRG